jgi:addiction module HigA family antidote
MQNVSTAHPGRILRERFLEPLGITPRDLAESLDLPLRRLNAVLSGTRSLDADMALRLGLFFEVPARWWLEMQARYDADAPDRIAELRSVIRPYALLERILVTPKGVITLEPSSEPTGPYRAAFSETLLARLRAQAALEPPRAPREPMEVLLPDGRLMLTSREVDSE